MNSEHTCKDYVSVRQKKIYHTYPVNLPYEIGMSQRTQSRLSGNTERFWMLGPYNLFISYWNDEGEIVGPIWQSKKFVWAKALLKAVYFVYTHPNKSWRHISVLMLLFILFIILSEDGLCTLVLNIDCSGCVPLFVRDWPVSRNSRICKGYSPEQWNCLYFKLTLNSSIWDLCDGLGFKLVALSAKWS